MTARPVFCGLAALLLVLVSIGGAHAESPATQPAETLLIPKPTNLAPVLLPILTKHQTPGMIAAILDGEHITAIGAVGVRKTGEPNTLTVNDLIHLGSCTKAMTATLIARQVDAKELAWDTPMSKALPRLARGMDKRAAQITVAQLLSHTAGLPPNVDWWKFDRTHQPLTQQRLTVAREVLSKPPATAPGKKYEYSNVDYVILGAILEEKLHRPWESIIEDELFKPLGMRSAGFGAPGTPGRLEQPWGHTGSPPQLKPVQFDNAPCLGPAGRVHCTIEDWGRFVSLHLQALRGRPYLASADAYATLHTPAKGFEYAGGWLVVQRKWAGGQAFTHTGTNTTWYCVVWMAPKKNFAVLVATNSGQANAAQACDDASAALIAVHARQPPNKK